MALDLAIRSLRPRFFAALALSAFALGCPNTDTAVFVEPSLSDDSVHVMAGPLGVDVTGSFTLDLHLGARADASSTVSLGDFEIVTASDKSPIGSQPLPVVGDKKFPLTVDQDSTVTVHFTFDTGKAPLPSSSQSALCTSGGVAIKGTLTDSLVGSATPVFSATFHPTGC